MGISSKTYLLLFCLLCTCPVLSQQGETANELRERAISYSQSFIYDSAITYHELAKASFIKEGDTSMYYMSDIDISYELLRKGLLKESGDLASQAYALGKPYLDNMDKGRVFRAIAHANSMQGKRELALTYYDSVFFVLKGDTSYQAKRTLAIVSSDKGIMQYGVSDFKMAEEYWKNALDILAEISTEKVAKIICEVSMNASVVIQYRGGYFEASEILQNAHDVALKHLPENKNMLSFIRMSMARGYSFQGFYDKSIEYYRYLNQTLEYLGDSPNKIQALYEVASIYSFTNRYEEALKSAKEGLLLTETLFGKNDSRIASGYNQIGDIMYWNGEYEASIENYQKALQIENDNGREYVLNASLSFRGIGLANRALGKREKAIYNLKKAIKITEETNESTSYFIAGYSLFLGKTYLIAQQTDSALHYFQKALVSQADGFDSFDVTKSPEPDAIATQWVGYKSLIGKSQSFEMMYDKTKDDKYLTNALNALKRAKKLSERTKQESNVLEDKFRTQNESSNLSITGSRLFFKAYQRYHKPKYLDSMLSFMETGKSELIIKSVQNSYGLKGAERSEVVKLYEDLERSISHHKEQLYYAETSQDSVQIAIQTRNLYNLRSQQDTLETLVQKKNGLYVNSRFGDYTQNLQEIKARLKPNEMLLNYQIGDSSLFIISITNDTVKVFEEPLQGLFRDVNSITKQIGKPLFNKESVNQIQELAHSIYQKVLPEGLDIKVYDRLIIIPDNYLHKLPFEVLIRDRVIEPKSFSDLQYLVKDKDVIYANSTSLLLNQSKNTEAKANHNILAFAPVFDSLVVGFMNQLDSSRQGYGALAGTQDEVKNIAQYFDTKTLLGLNATERKIRELKNQYSILHIASHGILNSQNPMFSKILFSPNQTDSVNDGSLTTMELFNMEIPAELVVLSACNSGSGELLSGEGVISLANAFFYAGSKSIVMSLWTANDQSTASIIGDFYAGLADGQTKSEALRMAKLKYIEEADDIQSHPYYWAHLVVNGSNRPIKTSNNLMIYLLLITVMVVVIVVALKKQRALKM